MGPLVEKMFVRLFGWLFVWLFVCLFGCLFVWLFVCLFACLFVSQGTGVFKGMIPEIGMTFMCVKEDQHNISSNFQITPSGRITIFILF